MLLIEYTRMGYEAVIDITVDTCKVIHAVTAIGSAAGRNAGDIGFCLDGLCGTEVILHIKADIVSGNLLAPGLPERRCSAPVGKHHHIALMAHEEVVPAVAPVLGKRALRASEGNLNGRVSLCGVKLRGIEDPGEHVLPVHGLHHPGLGLVLIKLGEDVLVLEGNLAYGVVVHCHKLRGEVHGHECGKEGAVLLDAERRPEVKPQVVCGEAEDFTCVRHHVVHGAKAFCKGAEVDGLAVIGPDGRVYIIFE